MKTIMMNKVPKWNLIFSILFFFTNILSSQIVEKTFVNELDISENTRLHIKGPRNFSFEARGDFAVESFIFMGMSTLEDDYILRGKDQTPIIRIHQDFKIDTWDKSRIKQIVEIKLQTKDPSLTTELMQKINAELFEYNANVEVDCGLNIKKFNLIGDNAEEEQKLLELKDGSIYEIISLEIKARVTVPKKNKFYLDANYMKTTIGEHQGEIKAKLRSGHLIAQNVNDLYVICDFAKIKIDRAQELKIESRSSEFKVGQTDILKCMSSLSKYNLGKVGKMYIQDSATDQFDLETVGEIRSHGSTFTDYHIQEVESLLNLKAKSGDLFVDSVRPGFRKIILSNNYSTIQIGLKNTQDFIIANHQNEKTEYQYPKGLMSIKNTQERFQESWLMGDKKKAGIIEVECKGCKVLFDD